MSTELECRGFWGEEKGIEKRREGQKGASSEGRWQEWKWLREAGCKNRSLEMGAPRLPMTLSAWQHQITISFHMAIASFLAHYV